MPTAAAGRAGEFVAPQRQQLHGRQQRSCPARHSADIKNETVSLLWLLSRRLDATEQGLKGVQARILRQRRPLRGADRIGRAIGALLGRRKVAKHFRITISAALAAKQATTIIPTISAIDGPHR